MRFIKTPLMVAATIMLCAGLGAPAQALEYAEPASNIKEANAVALN